MRHGKALKRARYRVAFFALFLLASPAGAINIVFEPIYEPERSRQVHGKLVSYLEEATGLDFEIIAPKDYHTYWLALRQRDDYDLIYDAPHITDFLIQRRNYEPLVKASNPTSFTLVAGYSLEEPTLDAVFGRSVVTMSAPSFGYMLLMKFFPNPLRQPNITSAAQSWEDAVQIVFDQQADAAMLPTWMAQRYPQLVPIQRSDDYPGKAISAAPHMEDSAKQAITEALVALADTELMADIRFEMQVESFEPASPEDYAGHMQLLENLYGFSLKDSEG